MTFGLPFYIKISNPKEFNHTQSMVELLFSLSARCFYNLLSVAYSTTGNSIVSFFSSQSEIVKSPGLPSGRISPITTSKVSSVFAESEEFKVCDNR